MTIIEVMMSLAIFSMVSAGIYGFTSMFRNACADGVASQNLSRSARVALDKMVWGVRADGQPVRAGIWNARSFNVVSDNELQYTTPDGASHTLMLNGTHVEYSRNGADPETIFAPRGPLADDEDTYETTIRFNRTLPRVLQIDLIVGQRVVNRWHYATLSTQVALRN